MGGGPAAAVQAAAGPGGPVKPFLQRCGLEIGGNPDGGVPPSPQGHPTPGLPLKVGGGGDVRLANEKMI